MAEADRDELGRRLARYPKGALSYFDSCFEAAASVSQDVRKKVLDLVISNFRAGRRQLEGSALQPATGLSESSSEKIASAFTVTIGLLSDSKASAEDFVAAGKGVLFGPSHSAAARDVAEAIVQSRGQIDAIVRRTQLAGEVLPSYDSLDIVIDLRLQFKDNVASLSVPVAIAHLETDLDEKEVWFQLTKADAQDMVRKLDRCIKELELAEALKFVGN